MSIKFLMSMPLSYFFYAFQLSHTFCLLISVLYMPQFQFLSDESLFDPLGLEIYLCRYIKSIAISNQFVELMHYNTLSPQVFLLCSMKIGFPVKISLFNLYYITLEYNNHCGISLKLQQYHHHIDAYVHPAGYIFSCEIDSPHNYSLAFVHLSQYYYQCFIPTTCVLLKSLWEVAQ